MRGHIAGRSSTETTLRRLVGSRTLAPSGRLVDGRHGILERTARGKVLPAANPTLDLLVLELILHAALLATLLLCLRRLRLPVHARPEDDVLTHRGRLERWTRDVTLLVAEFRPRSPLCYLWVDILADNRCLDPSRHFDLLAVFIESVRHHRLRAVFVRGHLLGWERRGVVELLVVSPVSAAIERKTRFLSVKI